MSSPNPGISAAGRALGRTALNPASGPAAIGGMLQVGQLEDEPGEGDLTEVRTRLGKAISDITKLANAMTALVLTVTAATDGSGSDEHLPDIRGYISERVEHQEAS